MKTRAFQVSRINQAPSLEAIDLAPPTEEDVVVRVHACALNFADLLMITGRYQSTPTPPFTLGLEFAGEVVSLGAGVTHLAIGDRVACYTGQGGLAEQAIVPASRCVPIPASMSYEDAAAFQIAYGTSHIALVHRAHLQPGQRVLVLGAAGGVGLTAVELASRMGAEVIACARGPERLEVARQAGAHILVDSNTDDIGAAFRAHGRVDVVYDAIGEPLFTPALRACKAGAHVLIIGFAAGEVPQIPANYLLVKNITVHGLNWGGYLQLAPEQLNQSMNELLTLYTEGGLNPHISHRLPLDKADEALSILKSRKSTGKVIVTP